MGICNNVNFFHKWKRILGQCLRNDFDCLLLMLTSLLQNLLRVILRIGDAEITLEKECILKYLVLFFNHLKMGRLTLSSVF